MWFLVLEALGEELVELFVFSGLVLFGLVLAFVLLVTCFLVLLVLLLKGSPKRHGASWLCAC